MMRVVVSGGAGFIGSTFVRHLLAGVYPTLASAEVVVLDMLTYAGSLENLNSVMDDPRLSVVVGDICDRRLVSEVVWPGDVVVHCAAETHVDRSISSSAEFVRSNVLGTQTLLDAALQAGVQRMVHISTDEVYGSIKSGSWTESSPIQPNSPYSASKAASDLLALAYHRTHGLPVCITRCSNNYGPYQFPEKVIPRFVTNLLQGKTAPLYGEGDQVREWIHVDDHCRGIALVAEKGAAGEIYHIGGGLELSNRDLTGRILEMLDADWSSVQRVADREGHDARYSLDSSKISNELGYSPRIGFGNGLASTVRWYKDHEEWWRRRAGV